MDDVIREFRVRPVIVPMSEPHRWNAVLAEPLRIERGCASLDGVQGSGIAWDEKAVARFSA